MAILLINIFVGVLLDMFDTFYEDPADPDTKSHQETEEMFAVVRKSARFIYVCKFDVLCCGLQVKG